jgi:hypothetical protein
MSWIRPRTICILLLVTLWSAQAVFAWPGRAGAPQQGMNFTVEGKITRLSPGKFTISTEANIIFRVVYDDKTEIKHGDGRKASAKDLRIGVKVKVEGDLTEGGEVVAQKIELQQD